MKYEPLKQEPETLEFWKKNQIHQKAQKKNEDRKHFYFLDGPPYTSGKVHLGTAWNKALKDMVLRFKRMNGFDVWDRAGYDMHGLPTAHAVEKKLGIKHKDEIPKFGVDKFVKECIKLCTDNMKEMNKDFQRLGVWMDFENAYQSIKTSFIEGEWWLIKQAHKNKRLYEGEKTMTWCPKCGTALAKHELEYQNVKDDSVFLKFQVKNKENEFLIVWTTTPWTIPFNLAIMVNPELDYVRAKVDDEVWIVSKGLLGAFLGLISKKYEILEEFKGEKLEGLEYINPLEDQVDFKEIKNNHPKTHTVLLSKEYVDLSAGTGLVHTAPGCGPEDYEVGHRNNIPPFNNLNETGVFPDNMGKYSGWIAKDDDHKFIEDFKERGILIESTEVEHDYAHCWRCKSPVIFRTTTQWFFKAEDMVEQMIEYNKKIFWQPNWAGAAQFDAWLTNLRDNSITRQRYWGCPVPIWRCDKCDLYDVIGSVKELQQKAKQVPEDLHKPWIDEVKYPCKCGGTMIRIPDVLDVWVDAGTTSWTCLDYPQRTDLFQKMFPSEFILEGKDHIRGWFNILMVCSMVGMQKPSFKSVYMHGFIQDSQGRKMSKSLGNYILPEEVVDKYGADTLRYYMIGGTVPGVDINYNFEDMKVKNRNLSILWNLHNYLIQLSKELNQNPKFIAKNKLALEEKYIFSKLNSTIVKVTELFNQYQLNEIPWAIEEIFLSLSRTYVQLIREKSTFGTEEDKKTILYTLYHVLLGTLKLFAPVAPFITEAMYQNLKMNFALEQESIHLFNWPQADINLINEELEKNMDIIKQIIQSILYAREKAKLGIRWPLKEVVIVAKTKTAEEAIDKLSDIIKNQTNVKEITVVKSFDKIKESVKADFNKLGPDFGNKSPAIIAQLATMSPNTILSKIEKQGKLPLVVNGESVSIVKEHLIHIREVPSPYHEAEFRGGFVYINAERTDELDAEGYAREIMRRVQAARKKAGLQKTDNITLFIKVSDDLLEMVKSYEKMIKQKCGAEHIRISNMDPAKEHTHNSKEKVRREEFEVMFDKIE